MRRWDLEVRQPPNSAPTPAHTPGGTAEAASSDAHSAMRCSSGRGELDPAVPQRALFRWSSRFPVAAQQKSHVGVESCSRGELRKDHITGATKPAFPNLQGSDELGHHSISRRVHLAELADACSLRSNAASAGTLAVEGASPYAQEGEWGM